MFVRHAFVSTGLQIQATRYELNYKQILNHTILLYMYAECLQFKTEYTECHKKNTCFHEIEINKAN